MSESYRALLKGDHLEWQDEKPVTGGRAIAVQVTLLDDAAQKSQQGARMAAALERLAENQAFVKLDDPTTWEKNLREERDLPDRN